jgi:hypothetical protein
MKRPSPPSGPDPTSLVRRGNELRAELVDRPPADLARRTGAIFLRQDEMSGFFELSVWGVKTRLTFPGLEAFNTENGTQASALVQTLLLYYFITANGAPLAGQWVSFAQLPGGRFYNQAFQGYTGVELARFFNSNKDIFLQACEHAGGIRQLQAPGDAAVYFQALPHVPLLLIYWEGDEDFPSSFQILFDSSVANYLPTDACAILGSNLTSRLKKHA